MAQARELQNGILIHESYGPRTPSLLLSSGRLSSHPTLQHGLLATAESAIADSWHGLKICPHRVTSIPQVWAGHEALDMIPKAPRRFRHREISLKSILPTPLSRQGARADVLSAPRVPFSPVPSHASCRRVCECGQSAARNRRRRGLT